MKLRTARLELRPIEPSDLDAVAAMNADPRVMDPLGGVRTREQSSEWLAGIILHFTTHGYGRFAVLREGALVAVVGLSRSDFDAGLMPGIEIAWRAPFAQWGNGYVTEAARAVLRDAFDRLEMDEIVSATTRINVRSQKVMDRIGMSRAPELDFDYPKFPPGHPLRAHLAWRVTRGTFR